MSLSSPGRWAALLMATLSSCTAILGIDKDYYETAGGGTGGDGGSAAASTGTGTGVGTGSTGSVGGWDAGPPPPECDDGEGVCLPAVPTADGWIGYSSVYSTGFGQGPSQCPDGSAPVRVFSGPSTATCSPCACGALQASCSAPLTVYSNNGCNGTGDAYNASTACLDINAGTNFVESVSTGAATSSGVTCPASGGALDFEQAWSAEHALCAGAVLDAGRCAGGEECVERSDAPVCITFEGDAAGCPVGWEAAARLVTYHSAIDQRGCGACSCTPPPGGSCAGGTFEFFENFICDGPPETVPEDTACANTTVATNVRYVAPPIGGSCMASGGEPSGSVLPEGPVTLCCR